MRKHGGTPSWRDKHVTLAAISPPGVARGRFVGGQQSGLAGSKPPPLFTREASSCSSQGRRQGEPCGASPRPSAPTYLPTWGVCCGCVCCGSGFGCAPPLLAGVLGCVCACVRAPLVPRHSWLGLAVWVCVLGLGFWLRPATPGWAVGVCFCLWVRSACTPPLLAGVCGVGLGAWDRVAAAPRHSWLGSWGVYVFVCALRLYPATPGWGVRCWCVCLGSGFRCAPPLLASVLGVFVFVGALRVYPATPGWGLWRGCACLGSGFGCAPPLLAGVLGCVCVCVRAPLVPCHSWLDCAACVCAFGLGFWLRPTTPGWVVRCGCVSLGSGFGCAPPIPAGVLVCVCVCGRAPPVPRHSWLECAVWVCVPGLGFWLRPCHSWLGCCGSVCVCGRAPLVPRHSWLGCAVWVCELGLGFRLRPATPGWGVGVCVCLWVRPACTPPLLAPVCGVGVGAWARLAAAPRYSWLGCWGVCVFVCAPLVPCHSWLGCAVWVCVLGLGFLLRPATPGCAVGLCVCLCARSACTPPLLAGVCGWGVCVSTRVSAAPRHSRVGCWSVCVFVGAPCLYPATPGWGVWCGCVCLGSGFGCAPATPGWGVGVCVCLWERPACTPPLLAGVCGPGVCARAQVLAAPRHSWLRCWGVCVFVGAPRLYPDTPGWGVRCGRGRLGSACGCAPPLLAGVLGCVYVCVCALLVPRHSWLGCALWVCVLRLGFGCAPPLLAEVLGVCVFVGALRVYPATPGLGVRCGCVCLGLCCGCAPPLLAGVMGCVCVCVHAPLVPRRSCLGCALRVCVHGLGFRLRAATPG